MDRFHLLAQVILALGAADFALDLRLDFVSDLENFLLAQKRFVHLCQATLHANDLEHLLAVLGIQAGKVLRDEIREPSRIVQRRCQRADFIGQLRRYLDDLGERRMHVSRESVDFNGVLGRGNVAQHLNVCTNVRAHLDDAQDFEPETTLDDEPDGAVRDPDRFVNAHARSDLMQIGRGWRFDGSVLLSYDPDEIRRLPVLVQKANGALAADRQGQDRLRKDYGISEGEDGDGAMDFAVALSVALFEWLHGLNLDVLSRTQACGSARFRSSVDVPHY